MRRRLYRLFFICATLSAAACSDLSDVGKQQNSDAPPFATVVVLNQPFSRDVSGKVTTRVRAGSEVFLSGKDSDGVVAPVLKFDWQSQGAAGSQPSLITRNATTVSFTVPAVTQETKLPFRLVVTDANGKTAQQDVEVTVVPVPDPDHFLTYELDSTAARKLKLVAIASRDVSAAEMAGLGDVEFEITVQRLVDYTTPGVDGPYLSLGTERLRGSWLAGFGAGSACDDPRNPAFQINKPVVDLDDVLARIDPAQLSLKPNPALVDQVDVRVQIGISIVRGSLPSGVQAQVCAPEVPTPVAAPATKWGSARAILHAMRTDAAGALELNLEQAMGDASESLDTPASARAYYDTIDPDRKRTNLLDWLKENGFIARQATSVSWADIEATSTAHAIYTNNFDLGFGRDMYARVLGCSSGSAPQVGQPIDVARVGDCDIAAVVINYTSLEAATKKLSPVLAVAMEYTATPNSASRRIVQFYTFAPDLTTGSFQRVLSANLDGRGEKYLPQVCTVCHGGKPGGLDGAHYANAGDVSATFLPWDLDSFLFSDADGASSDKSYSEESQRSRYTREAQSPGLRQLNQLAYLTYHDAARPARFALARELLEGWYGSEGTPARRAFINSAFNGDYTPLGWSADGADGVANSGDENPAAARTLYHDVFARNCRACHVAHVPPEVPAGTSLCSALTPVAGVIRPAVPHQLAIACYRQFIAEPTLASRISNGEMPFARLTMDRFWVGASGTNSPASALLAHFAQLQPPIVAATPGEPRADFNFASLIDADHPDTDIGSAINMTVDPAKTKFADSLQWSVERCATAGACTPVAVVGGVSSAAYWVVPDVGTYNLRLSAATSAGAASTPVVKSFVVEPQAPQIDQTQLPTTLRLGGVLSVKPAVTLGNGSRSSHRYWISDMSSLGLTSTSPGCNSQTDACTLDQTVSLEATVTGAGTGTFTVYAIDADGSITSRTRSVELTSGLSPTTTAVTTLPNVDAPINFAEDVAAASGERIEVRILSGPTASNALGSAGLLPAGASDTVLTRTYRPPARYANYDSGGTRRLAAEQIGFTLIRRRIADAEILEQRDFTREVRIQATTTFVGNVINQVLRRASAYPSSFQVCTNCHTEMGQAEFFRFDAGVTNQVLYDEVLLRIDLEDPAASIMLCRPSNDCLTPPAHPGGDRDPNGLGGDDDDLAPIRRWLEEGANNF